MAFAAIGVIFGGLLIAFVVYFLLTEFLGVDGYAAFGFAVGAAIAVIAFLAALPNGADNKKSKHKSFYVRKAFTSQHIEIDISSRLSSFFGNAEASYKIGQRYNKTGNYSEAYKYFSRASSKGHKKAMLEVAKMYVSGKGAHQDIWRGIVELECLSESNAMEFDSDTVKIIEWVFYNNRNSKKEAEKSLAEKALRCMRQLSEKGNPFAKVRIVALDKKIAKEKERLRKEREWKKNPKKEKLMKDIGFVAYNALKVFFGG
jgi:TPR repeat protein